MHTHYTTHDVMSIQYVRDLHVTQSDMKMDVTIRWALIRICREVRPLLHVIDKNALVNCCLVCVCVRSFIVLEI